MTEPANCIPLPQETAPRPIVRPLPPEKPARLLDNHGYAARGLSTVLFRVDVGWFEAYWYGQQTGARLPAIRRIIRQLRDALVVSWVHHPIWQARKNASRIEQREVPDSVAGVASGDNAAPTTSVAGMAL